MIQIKSDKSLYCLFFLSVQNSVVFFFFDFMSPRSTSRRKVTIIVLTLRSNILTMMTTDSVKLFSENCFVSFMRMTRGADVLFIMKTKKR